MIFDPTIRARYDFTKNREVVCGLPMLNPVTPDFANGDVATIAIVLPLGEQVLFSVLTTAGLVTLEARQPLTTPQLTFRLKLDGDTKVSASLPIPGGDVIVTLSASAVSISCDMWYTSQTSGSRSEYTTPHTVDLAGADGVELHPGTALYQISTQEVRTTARYRNSDRMLFDYDAPVCDEGAKAFLESNHASGVASVSDGVWQNGNYLKQHDETVIRWFCVKDDVPFSAVGVPEVDTSKDYLYRMELRSLKGKCVLLCQGVQVATFDRGVFKINGFGVQSFTKLVNPNNAIRTDHKPVMFVQNWLYPGDRYDLAQQHTLSEAWNTLTHTRVTYFLPAPCTVISYTALQIVGSLQVVVNGLTLTVTLTVTLDGSTVSMAYDGQTVGIQSTGQQFSNLTLTFYKGKATFRVGTQERTITTAKDLVLQSMTFVTGQGVVGNVMSPVIVAVGEEPGMIPYDDKAHVVPEWDLCVKRGKELVSNTVMNPSAKDTNFQIFKPFTFPLSTDKYLVAVMSKGGAATGTTLTFGGLNIRVADKVYIPEIEVEAIVNPGYAVVQVFNGTELRVLVDGVEVYTGAKVSADSLTVSADTYPNQNHIQYIGVADHFQYKERPLVENSTRSVHFNTAGAVKLPYTLAEVTGEFDYVDLVPEELDVPRSLAEVTNAGLEVYETASDPVVRSKAIVTNAGLEVYQVAVTKPDIPKPVIVHSPVTVYRLDSQEPQVLTAPELTSSVITVLILNRV